MIMYSAHYFIGELALYKLLMILFIIADLILFSYFIYILTNQMKAALLGLSLTPIFFQFRLDHDPILGYIFLMQIIFLLTILNLIFLLYYIQFRKIYYLVLSFWFFALCIITYEVTIPFLLLITLIIYYYTNDTYTRLKLITPFFTLSLVGISIPILLGLYYKVPSVGYTQSYVLSPNILVAFSTMVKQIVAAFPLSYFIFDPNKIFGDYTQLKFGSVFVFFVVLILYIYLLEDLKPIPSRIGIVGLFLLVLPSVVISLSSKYQTEVVLGHGYIPVYISYFGLSTIFIYMASHFNTNSPKKVFIIIAIMFAAFGAINYSNNIYVIENSNAYWLCPRLIIENGINDGLFNYIPDRSTLILDSNYPWDQPAFYIMHSKVRSILPPKIIDYYGIADNYNYMYNATYPKFISGMGHYPGRRVM